MKKFLTILIIVGAISLSANAVFAAGLTQSQINAIIGLLQSFGADSSVINNVQVSLSGGTPNISNTSTTPSPSPTPTISCVRFSHNLYLGQGDKETDNEVSKLQKFLKDSGHFTYPKITGYYGPATELAVQKFQAAQGVVSAGSYETTGYGVVGPKTQEKIVSISCGNQTPPTNVIPPTATTVTPPITVIPPAIVSNSTTTDSIPTISPPPTISTPTPNPSPVLALEISSINISSTFDTSIIEWNTNKPASSKVFLTGGNLSSKVYGSESGLSTRHVVHVSGLTGNTNYSYEIEAITDGKVVKKQGSYSTKQINENASLKITSSCTEIFPGTYCDVEVAYFENGQQKNISAITVSANDSGIFIESSYPGITCVGALAANSDGSQRKGNPLTCATRPSPRDGKPIAFFTYLPSTTGTRILTATANGATGTVESRGQIPECDGVVRGERVCQL